jgi:hypothetical protein
MMNMQPAQSKRPRWQKLGAAGWLLAGGAALLLVVLWRWSARLAPETTPLGSSGQPAGPVADGEASWGEPRPVTFPGESCRPWHISAVSDLPRPAGEVLLVTSQLADPHGLIAAGFRQECGPPARTVIVEEVGEQQVTDWPAGGTAAIGAAAVSWYQNQRPQGELVFAAVANPQARGWDRPPYAGVSPWVTAEALWARLGQLMPCRAQLGILAAKRAGTAMIEALEQVLGRAGRQLRSYRYAGVKDLPKILEQALKESGAWLVLWDASAAFEQEFEIILQAAEKAALPVAVSDEDHVRLGALAGVGTDSFRIGQQLCHLLQAQRAGRLPEQQRVFCPEYSFGVVHQARAEKLGYVFDGRLQLKVYKWH